VIKRFVWQVELGGVDFAQGLDMAVGLEQAASQFNFNLFGILHYFLAFNHVFNIPEAGGQPV
jgi:hypothetical protein